MFVVLSGDCSGSLHFEFGRLVHAETQELAGDIAAIEILSWDHGEFIASQRAPEQLHTVSMLLEGLLERVNGEPPLTTLTGIRRRPNPLMQSATPEQAGGAIALAAAATPGVAAVPPSPRAAEAGVTTTVLMSARGEIVNAQGPDAETVAGRIAYLARLAELVGQAMGSGETRSFRVRDAREELCARRYADGSLSGVSNTLGPGAPGPASTR